MGFVIDASVALSWYLDEDASLAGGLAFHQLGPAGAVAPILWWLEVRNALVVNERRGRLDTAATASILAHLGGFRSGWMATRTATWCSRLRGSIV